MGSFNTGVLPLLLLLLLLAGLALPSKAQAAEPEEESRAAYEQRSHWDVVVEGSNDLANFVIPYRKRALYCEARLLHMNETAHQIMVRNVFLEMSGQHIINQRDTCWATLRNSTEEQAKTQQKLADTALALDINIDQLNAAWREGAALRRDLAAEQAARAGAEQERDAVQAALDEERAQRAAEHVAWAAERAAVAAEWAAEQAVRARVERERDAVQAALDEEREQWAAELVAWDEELEAAEAYWEEAEAEWEEEVAEWEAEHAEWEEERDALLRVQAELREEVEARTALLRMVQSAANERGRLIAQMHQQMGYMIRVPGFDGPDATGVLAARGLKWALQRVLAKVWWEAEQAWESEQAEEAKEAVQESYEHGNLGVAAHHTGLILGHGLGYLIEYGGYIIAALLWTLLRLMDVSSFLIEFGRPVLQPAYDWAYEALDQAMLHIAQAIGWVMGATLYGIPYWMNRLNDKLWVFREWFTTATAIPPPPSPPTTPVPAEAPPRATYLPLDVEQGLLQALEPPAPALEPWELAQCLPSEAPHAKLRTGRRGRQREGPAEGEQTLTDRAGQPLMSIAPIGPPPEPALEEQEGGEGGGQREP
jgi:hypothetical protein